MNRPLPPHLGDPRRLEALRRSGLLTEHSELDYRATCRQACELSGADAGYLNVVTDNKQITVASWPLDVSGYVVDLEHSYCRLVVDSQVPVIIPDSLKDSRVAKSMLTGSKGGVLAYCGVPILSPERYVLGSLCVTDTKRREFGDTDVYMLQTLASLLSETLR